MSTLAAAIAGLLDTSAGSVALGDRDPSDPRWRTHVGLGQTIGETGWRLSQGERARVCLARALLADHDVLILDEPLDALDPHTARTCSQGRPRISAGGVISHLRGRLGGVWFETCGI